jgi:hypothetical protein
MGRGVGKLLYGFLELEYEGKRENYVISVFGTQISHEARNTCARSSYNPMLTGSNIQGGAYHPEEN